MEHCEREFQCFCYGFSPILVPDAHCLIVLQAFYITFPLYFDTYNCWIKSYFEGFHLTVPLNLPGNALTELNRYVEYL